MWGEEEEEPGRLQGSEVIGAATQPLLHLKRQRCSLITPPPTPPAAQTRQKYESEIPNFLADARGRHVTFTATSCK